MVFSGGGSMEPPLCTNGSAEYLMQLSVKFADDTAMIGLIKDNDDTIYQQQLAMFVNHCDANFLELNVSKTKELIIDFRISCSPPSSIVFEREQGRPRVIIQISWHHDR